MRKIKTLLATLILIGFSGATFADSVIVTETSGWKPVAIKVDPTASTYTMVGTVPADTTNYYYTYSGYRCFATQRQVVGVNAVIFKASVSGGSDIYCYPET